MVVTHGCNTGDSDILPAYLNVRKQVSQRVIQAAKPCYDAVIGITWPGYQNDLEYFSAVDYDKGLAPRLKSDLDQLT